MMSGFKLRSATRDDVANMARVSSAAFAHDTNTLLKLQQRGKLLESHGGVSASLVEMSYSNICYNMLYQNQKFRVLVAEDESSGEILGWICWCSRGIPLWEVENKGDDRQQIGSKDGGNSFPLAYHRGKIRFPYKSSPKSVTAEEERADSHCYNYVEQLIRDNGANPPDIEQPDNVKRLNGVTGDDLQNWMKKIMPEGTKCCFIVGVSVAPAHQGRGVGSALIRAGTDYADEHKVFSWVHSSAHGYRSFERMGFVEVHRLTVDLDEFSTTESKKPSINCESSGGDSSSSWGSYTFRYMRRDPKPS